jgi:glutaredoxin
MTEAGGNSTRQRKIAMNDQVVVYGSGWCGYTQRALRELESWGVDFRYVDVDDSPEDEQRIAAWNNGRSIRPTLDIGGDIFVNPDASTLRSALVQHGVLEN